MSEFVQGWLIVAMEIACCNIFFGSFGEKRKKNRCWNGMVVIFLMVLVFGIGYVFQSYFAWKEMLIIVVTAFLMYWIVEIKFLQSLILSVLYQALLLVVDYLTLLAVLAIFGGVDRIEEDYELQGAVVIGLGKMVLFLSVVLIKQYVGKKQAGLLSNAEWLRFGIFPIFSIGIVAAMLDAAGGVRNQKAEEICFIVAVGLAGMNVVVFYLMSDILERESQIQRDAFFRLQVQEQFRLYRSISENFEKQRKKAHEYKNQMLCIDSLLAGQNYEELKQFVKKLTGRLDREMDAIDTNHVLVNAVLNAKYQEARDKDILFVIKINDLLGIRMSDEDIVVILSNLLNNAIEACEKCTRKVMKLKFVREEGNIILSVKNTCETRPKIENGRIRTTKTGEEWEHGIGLGNIIDVIKKYQGSYVMWEEKGEFFFSAVMPE